MKKLIQWILSLFKRKSKTEECSCQKQTALSYQTLDEDKPDEKINDPIDKEPIDSLQYKEDTGK